MATIIELDPAEPWLPDEPLDPARRPLRRALVLILAVVILLTGPTALAGANTMRQVWRAPTLPGFFLLTEDAAYTVEVAGERLALVRRDLDTGDEVWRSTLDGPMAELYASGSGTLVSHFPPVGRFEAVTNAINTQDGSRQWSYPVPSIPLAYVTGDQAVLIDREPVTRREDGDLTDRFTSGLLRPHRMAVLDLKTGEERARYRIPEGTTWALPAVLPLTDGLVAGTPEQNWIALFDTGDPKEGRPAGLLEIRDLADFSLTAVARISGEFGERSFVVASPDAVLVRTEGRRGPMFTAYDPTDLSVKWQVTTTELFGTPYPCGPLLCVESDESIWAYNSATGTLYWRRIGLKLRPAVGDVSLMTTRFGEPLTVISVMDGKARPVGGEWRVVERAPLGPRVVVMAHANDASTGELAVVDSRNGNLQRLGPVTTTSGGFFCHSTGTHLACVEDEELRVWRLAQ